MRAILLLAPFLAACSSSSAPPASDDAAPPPRVVAVTLDASTVVARVSPRFLSYAVDTAEVVGADFWAPPDLVAQGTNTSPFAPFDFARPKLHALAKALSPAYLRIGGTDADKTYYDLSDAPGAPPPGYAHVMTRAQWDAVNAFALDVGDEILFTLDAGPSSRGADGHWIADNARALVAYTTSKGYPVTHWELGNEVNAYSFTFGPDARVPAASYALDLSEARELLADAAPSSRLVAPASAFFPTIGELPPLLDGLLAISPAPPIDVVSWHFYPMQSRRCPLVRPASLDRAFDPATLDDVAQWASEVEASRDAHLPMAEAWLGETGNAQCGGEPGISDAFAGAFWWVDELGQMARHGEQVVVRQTLSGSDYGLIDDATTTPNPDYWVSVLWKRTMGERVLVATSSDANVRVYAHCAAAGPPGAIAIALENLDRTSAASIDLGALGARIATHLLTGEVGARTIALDGAPLETDPSGTLPDAVTSPSSFVDAAPLVLPAPSIAFVIVDAAADACR